MPARLSTLTDGRLDGQRREAVMDNVSLLLFYIVEVQEIARLDSETQMMASASREQFAFSLDDEGCVVKELREPLMGAVMMGYDEPAPAYRRELPDKASHGRYQTSQPLGDAPAEIIR